MTTTDTDRRTPRELFERGLDLLLAADMQSFLELFAADAELEFPFAAAGAPARLHGQAELHDYLIDYPQRLAIHEFPAVAVHETTDPELIIVEFTARGTTVRTGAAYELSYIAVIRARHGKIVAWRDYWSPVAAAVATGTLPELLTELERTEGKA
ncbi:nuclear transport factor 2 family protein [Nocardia paucivorans]|uniref:nuclear transport factor 2 family protein n=1 Tax=Nocardia paucivorans TaxID=114259 RepID=UPI00031B70E2|nr:nuclear transport factor 2 family protein [Nocardia paucivorans]